MYIQGTELMQLHAIHTWHNGYAITLYSRCQQIKLINRSEAVANAIPITRQLF